jgi:hypothetical protein
MPLQALWQRLRWPLLAALLVLGSLAARATYEQVRAFERAETLAKSGNIDEAIDEFRWTLRWYTPWGPKWTDAANALVQIADDAEQAKAESGQEPMRALRALDALRSGLLAGRHLWQPRADLVAMVNARIPAVMVRVAAKTGDKRDPQQLLAQFTRDYARPVGVAPLTSAGVVLGFLAWLLGLLMLARRGLDAEARVTKTGWRWLAVAMGGFILWTLAMWLG